MDTTFESSTIPLPARVLRWVATFLIPTNLMLPMCVNVTHVQELLLAHLKITTNELGIRHLGNAIRQSFAATHNKDRITNLTHVPEDGQRRYKSLMFSPLGQQQ